MKILYILKSAFSALRVNKSRSVLTILGIVIGVTAIILVSVIGESAQSLVLSQVESLGSRTIAIVPGREPSGPADPSAAESLYADSLKMREIEALKKPSNVPDLEEAVPIVFGLYSASFGGETFNSMVIGSTDFLAEIFDIYPEEGFFFDEDDIKARAEVAIIGVKLKDELFGNSDAIGEKIRINGRNFRVIGVFPPKGQILFFNFDESAVVPFTSAQDYIFGIKHFNRIIVQAKTEESVPAVLRDIEITLRELHNITDPENDDFFASSQIEIAETLKTITDILTIFLAAVAAISLLVGGIGIMNIMLVSVTERTSEIGLRKALGATGNNILLQFIFESSILTTLGGLIGVLLGVTLSFLASIILGQLMNMAWDFSIPFFAAFLGIVISVLVGLLFGIYPAYKASQKSPIEALRYE